MQTLDDMEARAKRRLDGMTVNCDVMAKDVLQLVAAIRAAQARNASNATNGPTIKTPGFEWIDELLKPKR